MLDELNLLVALRSLEKTKDLFEMCTLAIHMSDILPDEKLLEQMQRMTKKDAKLIVMSSHSQIEERRKEKELHQQINRVVQSVEEKEP